MILSSSNIGTIDAPIIPNVLQNASTTPGVGLVTITNKERAVIARAVRATAKALASAKFKLDPLVSAGASLATSRVSSSYKRHGKLIEQGLAVALNTCSGLTAWSKECFSHSAYTNGFEVDLIVHDSWANQLDIFEIKRGGDQDSDATRGIKKRLAAAQSCLPEIIQRYNLGCRTSQVHEVSYYGSSNKSKRPKLNHRDLSRRYGPELSAFIDEISDYYRFKIGSAVAPPLVQALQELGIDTPDAVLESLSQRTKRVHPWDLL